MKEEFTVIVNGEAATVRVDPDMPLLYVLRNHVGATGPKFGCGLAQCGACTVLQDREPIRSCVTPVSAIGDSEITTIEGLGSPSNPHPIQTALIQEQAPQCGYCYSGWVLYSAALLERNPDPTDAEIRSELAGLKCRCGTQDRVIKAVKRAAEAQRA